MAAAASTAKWSLVGYRTKFGLGSEDLGNNKTLVVPTFASIKSLPRYVSSELTALISAQEKLVRQGRYSTQFSKNGVPNFRTVIPQPRQRSFHRLRGAATSPAYPGVCARSACRPPAPPRLFVEAP